MKDSKVEVYIEKCRDNASIPTYAREGDAGMDVCAAIDADIYPGQTKIVQTGLKLAIPEGYEIQVRPRSGLSYKTHLRIANSPGTIDSGYRDEVGIIISNTGLCSGGGSGVDMPHETEGRTASGEIGTQAAERETGLPTVVGKTGLPTVGSETGLQAAEEKLGPLTVEREASRPTIECERGCRGCRGAVRKIPVFELSDPELEESVEAHCLYRIKTGDRVAQLVLLKVPTIDFVVTDSVADIGKDRGGGFGSSGVK